MALALLENSKIILGSASPRRHELLKLITPNFFISSPTCDETLDSSLEISKAIEDVSKRKALSITEPCDILITADTLVVLGSFVLGKPLDKNDAFNMLSMLSNNTHEVITAVSIKTKDEIFTFSESTKITFKEIKADEILEYLETDEPYDKAGAYGVQGIGNTFVTKIDGDYFNVVGLPVKRLKHFLERL